MQGQILVAYCSKHGATGQIAEKIGQVLGETGLDVEVWSIDRSPDPARYAAVIFGSAVYFGGWRKAAQRFLRDNEGVLAERPVWLFSSGPTGEGELEAFMKGKDLPESLQPVVDKIALRGAVVFRGAVDVGKLGLLERWVVKRVDSPIGDFREWNEIGRWASGIADALKSETG